jgi:uncharacterized repeat protein (TIGR03809 family)
MTQRIDVAGGRHLVARWCALAERRLEHLTELFETGRWRRYHSELAFLQNIQEAQSAVAMWRALLRPDSAGDDDIHADLPLSGISLAQLRPVQNVAEPVHETISIDANPETFDAPLSAPALVTDDVSDSMLELMQQRYPSLRSTL